jgi:outer membrane protein
MPTYRLAALTGCGLLLGTTCLAAPAFAETLADAVALAYQTNPTLQAERAQLRATDEEYPQAQSGLRPSVNASASYAYQDQQVSVPRTPTATVTGGTGTALVSLSQPLYSGGRVTSRIDAAAADILAERENLRHTEISVLQSVVQAYVDVRRDAEQLAISKDNVSVLAQQLEETKARFDVGQLTQTDLSQSEARLARAKSQLATAQARLADARAAYVAAVGQAPGDLAPEPPIAPALPASVDAAFAAAEADNPQLRQAAFLEAASDARLAEARAQTRPTVSASAQLGYVGSQLGVSSSFGGAPGQLEQEQGVTVSISATQPIFTGGLTSSQIRQAAEQRNVARQQVESARRTANEAVAEAWDQLLGAQASRTADEQQVASNQVALEGVRAEQGVGLRTVLDVLNAQQELETSQLALVGDRHDEYVAAVAVLAATGRLDARLFASGERPYDPKANFAKVRHAIGWVPWEGAVGALDRIGAPRPQSPPSKP